MEFELNQARQRIIAAFHKQVEWCGSLGSPFTAQLLMLLADHVAADGPGADLIMGWVGDPVADALPLRLAGAMHALVLGGTAPDLAACYPPNAPVVPEFFRACLSHVMGERADFIRQFLSSPPQTNEVGRSAVLLGGFLRIAAETCLPLRLLEIGASAGLNSVWDQYHYRLGSTEWGDPDSPVELAPEWHGPDIRADAPLHVLERYACDLAPVDLEDAAQRLRLKAYVWADQRERLARLDAAITVVRNAGLVVERADAGDWVARRLQEMALGSVTVLYHSIMWQYMPEETQRDIAGSVLQAGLRATANMPLAWLRFEPRAPERRPELCLTLWPDQREFCLGSAQPHGSMITWSHA